MSLYMSEEDNLDKVVNSQTMRAAFPNVYRDFFSRCPLVLSTSLEFTWVGDHTHNYGGISIRQKLPLKIYVGIEPASDGRTEINNFFAYNPDIADFEQFPASYDFLQAVTKLLNQELTKPIKIHLLIESRAGTGLNTSSGFASCLACAILLAEKKMLPEDIERWQTLSSKDLLKDENFQKVFKLAVDIDTLGHAYKASGAGVFSTIKRSLLPIVYFSQNRITNEIIEGRLIPQAIKPIDFVGFSLDEISHLPYQPSWPIDFGLIYSGSKSRINSAMNAAYLDLSDTFADFTELMEGILERFERKDFNLAVFARNATGSRSEKAASLWENYIFSLMTSSAEALLAFYQLFAHGSSEESQRLLFRAINRSHDGLRMLNVSSSYLDQICRTARHEAKKTNSEVGGAAKLTSKGKGGYILFASPVDSLRHHLKNIFDEVKKESGRAVSFEYLSWRDGIGEDGIKIEQNLEGGKISAYLGKALLKLKTCVGEVCQEKMISSDIYSSISKQFDLVLDHLDEKVSIAGEEVSSEEIYSQTATIAILEILLANHGKSVPCGAFPHSSYAANRNEFQGKISSPLNEVLKNRCGKNLVFDVHGSFDDFSVRLNSSSVTIAEIFKA